MRKIVASPSGASSSGRENNQWVEGPIVFPPLRPRNFSSGPSRSTRQDPVIAAMTLGTILGLLGSTRTDGEIDTRTGGTITV